MPGEPGPPCRGRDCAGRRPAATPREPGRDCGQTGSPPARVRKGLALGRGPSQRLGVRGIFAARWPGMLQAGLHASPRAQVCASPGQGQGARLAVALRSEQSPQTPVPIRWHFCVPSKQTGLQLGWQASAAAFGVSFHLGLLWFLRKALQCIQTSFPAIISCLGGWMGV